MASAISSVGTSSIVDEDKQIEAGFNNDGQVFLSLPVDPPGVVEPLVLVPKPKRQTTQKQRDALAAGRLKRHEAAKVARAQPVSTAPVTVALVPTTPSAPATLVGAPKRHSSKRNRRGRDNSSCDDSSCSSDDSASMDGEDKENVKPLNKKGYQQYRHPMPSKQVKVNFA